MARKTAISSVFAALIFVVVIGPLFVIGLNEEPLLLCLTAPFLCAVPALMRAMDEEINAAWNVATDGQRHLIAAALWWPAWGLILTLIAFFASSGDERAGRLALGATFALAVLLYEAVAGPATAGLRAARGPERSGDPRGARPSTLAAALLLGLEQGRITTSDGVERVQGRRAGREVTIIIGGDRRVSLHVPADEVLERTDVTPGLVGAPGQKTPLARAFAALFEPHGLQRARTRGRLIELSTRHQAPAQGGLFDPGVRDRILALVDAAVAIAARPPQEVGFVLTPVVATGSTCPYCRDALSEAPVASCDRCGTEHHAECLDEVGGCTVLGCGGERRREPVPTR